MPPAGPSWIGRDALERREPHSRRTMPTDRPRAWILDVDGILALIGDRSPYDIRSVSIDTPHHPVALAAQASPRTPTSMHSSSCLAATRPPVAPPKHG